LLIRNRTTEDLPHHLAEKVQLKNCNLVAVIPVYNEADSIRDVITKTEKHATSIIVVDDGSTDETVKISRSLNVKVIRNSRRMGKGVALKRGIIDAMKLSPEIIVTLDGDGQHDPDDIPKLIAPIQQTEADIVIGSRYESDALEEIPSKRKFGLSIVNKTNTFLTRSRIVDSQSGFRAYDGTIMDKIISYTSTGYGVETEQLALADSYGFLIAEVPVLIRYKGLKSTSKKNSYHHGAIIMFTILRILFEKRPLIFFGLSGVALLLLALITGTQMLHLFNETRYFSIPLGMIALGLVLCGGFLILVSLIFYGLAKMRIR
jgi:glycosyltransferase involved in cell wall biosynthesis